MFSKPISSDFITIKSPDPEKTFELLVTTYIPKGFDQTYEVAESFVDKAVPSKIFKALWEWCVFNFVYEEDKEGIEQIRLPNRTWADRNKGVDCEDFVILNAGILHNLDIPFSVRMADYGEGWQHIYIVGDNGVILDPVNPIFNNEPKSLKRVKDHRFEKESKTLGKFIQYNFEESSQQKPIDLLADSRTKGFFEKPSPESVKALNRFLKANPNQLVVMYHGTWANHPIMSQGLKTTKANTRRGYSTVGFVYLTPYPKYAESFAQMAYPSEPITLYKVVVPARFLKPDNDQIYFKKSAGIQIGDTLGDSLVFAKTARIKGDIPPYMISEVGKTIKGLKTNFSLKTNTIMLTAAQKRLKRVSKAADKLVKQAGKKTVTLKVNVLNRNEAMKTAWEMEKEGDLVASRTIDGMKKKSSTKTAKKATAKRKTTSKRK
ncbi:hypothetical protein FHS57_005128 [Runella defluvii]|uniref:Transglutaminase-like domain-containing protein n=1 Tax=Runella defluvii TaxID=370973 RepID=A0A7W5ZT70_9BACT|nr:hypothetical protein [Runella defluvii]MBB3841107.1 hypothetical protein [Runella defluvii]